MATFHIRGGIPLQGKVHIQGSKNAALPILAATLLTKDICLIDNCPNIMDVQHMACILKQLGCRVLRTENGYMVDSSRAVACSMSGETITGMRSSLCLLGAMLARFSEVSMEYPGGCVIGERPIDLHINALEKMGVTFTCEAGRLVAGTKALTGAEIYLSMPSVGATENVILAAVAAEGDTQILGAAKEPEVVALCGFLQKCGADIEGVGTSLLTIHGGRPLHGAADTVCADRIVAGTYLFACVGCGGSVFLEDAPCAQMDAVIHLAEQMGCNCQVSVSGNYGRRAGLYVEGMGKPKPIKRLQTKPYPGFPTDLQSAALSVCTIAAGKSCIEETIFENRFRIVPSLAKMGAEIEIYTPQIALVRGVEALHGANVEAKELRGGAALLVAAMMAEGHSVVSGTAFIERGYENIGKDLKNLGARIVSV